MRNGFTAIIERDGEWFIAYCPEIPGANGQGRTKQEARESLAEAIALILEDRREDSLRGVPVEAERETVVVSETKHAAFASAATWVAILSATASPAPFGLTPTLVRSRRSRVIPEVARNWRARFAENLSVPENC
jgi:predicted RNase H-like HicB family nuclease